MERPHKPLFEWNTLDMVSHILTLHFTQDTLHSGIRCRALLVEGARRLKAAGVESARREAEWLLSRLLGADPLALYLEELEVPTDRAAQFLSQIDARAAGKPLQYLVGDTEFLGERIRVAPGVFIPRPETEAVVEAALPALRARQARLGRPLRLLDLGTGSGCIAVLLATRLPSCAVVAVEVSWDALRIARENVERHQVAGRVHLVQGRWLEPIRGDVDGIVSNPPYIPSRQVDQLPLDVRQEPRISLDGGPDGMRIVEQLLAEAPRVLGRGGLLAVECGKEQVAPLLRIASMDPRVKTAGPLHDMARRPRGILLHRHGCA